MLNIVNFPLFLSATLTLCIIPGPDMLYIMARSMGQGQKAGIVSALGFSIGLLAHTCAAALGLSVLLMSSTFAYGLVNYLGAAYLIFLGVSMLLSKKRINSLKILKQVSLKCVFSQAIITNLLNPKTILFFLAFLPMFVNTSKEAVVGSIIFLGSVFNIIATGWNISLVFMSSLLTDWFRNRPGFSILQQWFTGSVLISLGIYMVFSEIIKMHILYRRFGS